ncbi:MAG: peptide chain release factor 3, partial [Thermomicrobiales bacterium]
IEEEGAIQLFYPVSSGSREPVLAAVGQLQFDVVRFRLESEYGVETIMEPLTYTAARWVTGDDREITAIGNGRGRMRAEDRNGRPVILFTTERDLRYAEEHAEAVTFQSLAGL